MQAIGEEISQVLRQYEEKQGSTTDSGERAVFDWKAIPKRFQGKRLADFEVTQEPDPRKLGMNALREGRGVFLTGAAGRGKTHLAIALAASYIPTLPAPIRFEFMPSVEFFLNLKLSFDKGGEAGVLSRYTASDILLFDDIGSEKVSDWSRQMFYTLIDRRYRNMRQTILTSNMGLAQLSEQIDDRIASRIVEMCEVITLTGRDYRLRGRSNEPPPDGSRPWRGV